MTISKLNSYLVIALLVLGGGWLLQMGVARAEREDRARILFDDIVDKVNSDFVEGVDADELYESAIEGLLQRLADPYSSYLPARVYENLRIRTEGDYGGLGLEVVDRDGRVTVVNTIPGTPGARSGIKGGDAFFEIDGVRADTMVTEQTVALLRGKPGTRVRVKMTRPGVAEPIAFEIERATIELLSVPFATLIDGIGYVPVEVFREATANELRSAIDSLALAAGETGGPGLKGLVLDIRNNPGGLLREGVAATDLFLDEGLTVVETRGRRARDHIAYRTESEDRYPGLPVVVLVNRSSASASEILAGALQDHDRATVLGEATFGKGSVQTYYSLRGGDALRLTTAKWFTPGGRTISRAFADRRGSSSEGNRTRSGNPDQPEEGGDTGRAESRLSPERGQYRTSIAGRAVAPVDTAGRPRFSSMAGRTLYGGGGVVPDVFVTPDLLSEDEEESVARLSAIAGVYASERFAYAVEYLSERPGLGPDFLLEQEEIDEFASRLTEIAESAGETDLAHARRFIRYGLEMEIARQALGAVEAFHRMRGYDDQLDAALQLLSEPESDEGSPIG